VPSARVATETIEQVVLGMGKEAAPFMKQLPAPPDDDAVSVIEIDGMVCKALAGIARRIHPQNGGKIAPPVDFSGSGTRLTE
jgi:hypothetical protein